jgi:predicted DNA-binding antitoxin AbrB/MazE fold protein
MTTTIRARFRDGVLEPLESVDLSEGEEVTVTIATKPADIEAFRRAAGSWRGRVDADVLIRDIYADRLISSRPRPEL